MKKSKKRQREGQKNRSNDVELLASRRRHRRDADELPVDKTHITLPIFKPLKLAHQEFDFSYFSNDFVVGVGCAGTGKTFRAVYLALRDVLDVTKPQDKLIFIRTTVPVRNDGHLPGTAEEKAAPYERPFMAVVNEICGRDDAYGMLKKMGIIEFHSTSHEQGLTYRNAVIVMDEIQNYTFKELDLITTRRGQDCKLIAVGDSVQDYVSSRKEQSGLNDWLDIMESMAEQNMVGIVRFEERDIVRDEFVKNYIVTKNRLLKVA